MFTCLHNQDFWSPLLAPRQKWLRPAAEYLAIAARAARDLGLIPNALMSKGTAICVGLAAILSIAPAPQSSVSADPVAGQNLADKWCVECHGVRADRLSPKRRSETARRAAAGTKNPELDHGANLAPSIARSYLLLRRWYFLPIQSMRFQNYQKCLIRLIMLTYR